MWIAIGINQCAACAGWPALGFLSVLAANPTGVIIVATALLFPTTALLYGGITMFFAARETVERWAAAKDAKAEARGREEGREEGREQGRKQGREEGRREIVALLEELNVQLPPEVLRRVNGGAEPN